MAMRSIGRNDAVNSGDSSSRGAWISIPIRRVSYSIGVAISPASRLRCLRVAVDPDVAVALPVPPVHAQARVFEDLAQRALHLRGRREVGNRVEDAPDRVEPGVGFDHTGMVVPRARSVAKPETRDGGALGTPVRGEHSGRYLTVSVPRMPAAAWPGTVQRYLNFPAFSVTLRVVDLPGWTFVEVLPAILKSCSSLPLVLDLERHGALRDGLLRQREVELRRLARGDVTVVAFAVVVPVPTADAVSGAASARLATAAETANHLLLISPSWDRNPSARETPADAVRSTTRLTMPAVSTPGDGEPIRRRP